MSLAMKDSQLSAFGALAALLLAQVALGDELAPQLTPRTLRPPATPSTDPMQLKNKIGANIGSCNYFSSTLPFVDLVKCADYAYANSNTNPGVRDEAGWLKEMPKGETNVALLMGGGTAGKGSHIPLGVYNVRWEGTGPIKFAFAASKVLTQGEGFATFDYDPSSNNGRIDLWQNGFEADYIHNIRVTLPGGICKGDPFHRVTSQAECRSTTYLPFVDHPEIVWNPDFLRSLRGYSVIRFMDGLRHTNNSREVDWPDATPLDYYSYGTLDRSWAPHRGTPWALVFDLCNQLKSICWITIPALATDDYVEQLAELARDTLDPGIGVYVEHSNEVWNARFQQFHQLYPLAQAEGITLMSLHARRTKEMADIFKAMLGEPRVWSVLGVQTDHPKPEGGTVDTALRYMVDTFGAENIGIDAEAITTYFAHRIKMGELTQEPWVSHDVAGAFDYLRAKVMPTLWSDVEGHRIISDKYGLHLISYEGGPGGLVAEGSQDGDPMNQYMDTIAADPRMGAYYLDAVKGALARGLELHNQFVDTAIWSRYGRWGAKQWLDEETQMSTAVEILQGETSQ